MSCIINLEGTGQASDIRIANIPDLGLTEGIRLVGAGAAARNIWFDSTDQFTSGGIRIVGSQCVVDGVRSPSTTLRPTILVDGAIGPVISNVVDGTPPI